MSYKRIKWIFWNLKIVTEIKNSLGELHSRFELAEERICECEGRFINTVQPKNGEEKGMSRPLEKMWDTVKCNAVHIMEILEEEGREKEAEKSI